ncbi:MAG: MFS transporter, partial [Brevundimonas sp.]|nr:MFS transporter [Brevundimonas sp.]
ATVSRFAERTPSAWLCAIGGACLAVGLAGAALQAPDADSRAITPLLVLCGLGFGLFQTPNNRTLFLAASPERSGAAGGIQGTARLTGQTAGAVLVALLFATTSVGAAPRMALAAGAALALIAGLVSASRGRSG